MPDRKCPVINALCRFYTYTYQEGRNGDVVICYCDHPDNTSECEGNCTRALCPFVDGV